MVSAKRPAGSAARQDPIRRARAPRPASACAVTSSARSSSKPASSRSAHGLEAVDAGLPPHDEAGVKPAERRRETGDHDAASRPPTGPSGRTPSGRRSACASCSPAPALEKRIEGIDLAGLHHGADPHPDGDAPHLAPPVGPGAERVTRTDEAEIARVGADGLADRGLAEIAVPGPGRDLAAVIAPALGAAFGVAEAQPLESAEMGGQAVRHRAALGRAVEGTGRADPRQQRLLHQQRHVARLRHLGRAHPHVDQPEGDGVGVVDVDGGPDLVPGVDALQHLAGRVGVPDLGDHARRRVHPAEVHQRLLEVTGAGLAGARRRHRDLDRAGDAVLDRVL